MIRLQCYRLPSVWGAFRARAARGVALLGVMLGLTVGVTGLAAAQAGPPPHPELSRGQTLYVPAYSQIFFGDQLPRPVDNRTLRHADLAVTLNVHNVDAKQPIMLQSVKYFDSQGKLLEERLATPRMLLPFEHFYLFVERQDRRGGVGANFILEWKAENPANPPLVETIMIFDLGNVGYAFTSQGRVIIPH